MAATVDTPLYFLIAGEASGDLLGARLMHALKAKTGGQARFAGVGGPRMEAEGLVSHFPQSELAHMGVVEVVRHLPLLLRRIRETATAARHLRPRAVVTIDSPDFSFRVAKRLKGSGIPLIHYVAPSVWAWRAGRARKIARLYDHLLALLPFEPPYFTSEGLACTFVGHPIIESKAGHGDGARFRTAHGIAADTTLLTVLPGSRMDEVTRLLPIFRAAVGLLREHHPNLQIVMPVVPHLRDIIRAQVADWPAPVLIVEGDNDKYDAMAASRAAMACSGTVSLELALARLPAVIAYKTNALTAALVRRLIRVKYANLVNLMHGTMAVPELLQENCTPEKLAAAVEILLADSPQRAAQISDLADVAAWLGQGQFIPSERAAEVILSY